MAIAYDSAASGTRFASTGTSHSFNHTTSGSDRFLTVQVGSYRASGGGDVVSGVTYNGVAMTLLGQDDVQPNTEYYFFHLVNPATGTNTVTVTYASTNFVWAVSASYTGVDQSSPIDSSAFDVSGQNVRSSITSTTTVVANDCWLVGGFFGNNGGITAGAGTTVRLRSTTDPRLAAADSNSTVSTGSQSLVVSCTNNATSWGIASIKPAGGGGGTPAQAARRGAVMMM